MKQSFLERLTGSQLIKIIPAFYGTRRFITAFTSASHLSLSRARSIQSMSLSHFLKIHFNSILPSTSDNTFSTRFSAILSYGRQLAAVIFAIYFNSTKLLIFWDAVLS